MFLYDLCVIRTCRSVGMDGGCAETIQLMRRHVERFLETMQKSCHTQQPTESARHHTRNIAQYDSSRADV